MMFTWCLPTGTVTLDGSASSDVDGDLLTYSWSFVSKPTGSNAALSNTIIVNPIFVADLDGSYVVQLVVHDGILISAGDTVTITASTPNTAPVANAINYRDPVALYYPGDDIYLVGDASDADGDDLTYHWSVIRPEESTAERIFNSDGNTLNGHFYPDAAGTYVIEMKTYDDDLYSNTVSITIVVATVYDVDWIKQFGTSGSDYGNSITTDGSGNLFVVGDTDGIFAGETGSGGKDVYIARYDSNGRQVWIRQFGTSRNDWGISITSDGSGNLFVAGYTGGTFNGETSSGGDDAFIAKYDSDGTQIWVRQFGTSSNDSGYSITTDGNGNLFVTGWTYGTFAGETSSGGEDSFIVKYDSNGNQDWVRQFGTSGRDWGESITTDGSGNLFVTGRTYGTFAGEISSGGTDAYIARYNSTGEQVWIRQFGTSGGDTGESITTDGNGNLFVTGSTSDTFPGETSGGYQDAFIAKYDSDGTQIWVKQFGTFGRDTGESITTDGDGNLFVAGSTSSTFSGETSSGGDDAFIAKYDSDGVQVWINQFGTSGGDTGKSITTDGNGNLFVTGRTYGTFAGQTSSGRGDAFVAAMSNFDTLDPTFDGDGVVVDNNAAGGDGDDVGNDMALDSEGNIYVTGYSYNVAGTKNMVIWKYKSNGTLDTTFSDDGIMVHPLSTASYSSGNAIALDSTGNIYVTGSLTWKYKSDGTPDITFSGNGIVGEGGSDIAVDNAGNVYLTGSINNTDGNKEVITRKYKSDGTLDATFGDNGVVTYYNDLDSDDYEMPNCRGNSLVLDSSANVYVVGECISPVYFGSMFILKYKSDGTFDSTLNDDGVVEYDSDEGIGEYNGYGGGSYYGNAIILDDNRNIYVTGYFIPWDNQYMMLWKYNSDGTLDTTFSDNGVILSSPGGVNDGNAIALDSVGDVYITGYTTRNFWDPQNYDMLILKYRSDGIPDNTFGENGVVAYDGTIAGSDVYDEWGNAIALDSTGNVYVTGASNSSGYPSIRDMTIWKYK